VSTQAQQSEGQGRSRKKRKIPEKNPPAAATDKELKKTIKRHAEQTIGRVERDALFLLGLERQLDENLLQLLVHKVDAELLKPI
jgi:hypothetical protein